MALEAPGLGTVTFWWLLILTLTGNTEAQSGCGGNVNGISGVLRSPGYPANVTSVTNGQHRFSTCYPWRTYSYSDCVWYITTPDTYGSIELTITDMQFTQNECCRNYIEVRDGPGSGVVLSQPCGKGSFPPILSSGNTMRVQLRNSNVTSGHSFQAQWRTVCSKKFTSSTGELQSPGHPSNYPGNKDCTYLIEQPRGFQIQINFTHFRMDDAQSNGNCLDYLEIFDGPTESFPRLGTETQLCGTTIPGSLTSTRNQVFIKFHSDSTVVSDRTGFRATFERTVPECTTWTNLPESGLITSPGFPRVFPISATCTWEIPVPRLKVIDFIFHSIELGPDNDAALDCDHSHVRTVVSLYKVLSSGTEKLMARYCRRNTFSHLITTEPYTRKLKVVFESRYVTYYSSLEGQAINGFNASYSSRAADEYQLGADGENVLDYGPYKNDEKAFPQQWSPVAVPMNPNVTVGDKQYRYALIFRDGNLAFSSSQHTYVPTHQRACSYRNYENICPYCANINISSDVDAAVYYRVHKKGNSISNEIFSKVHSDISRFKGTNDFNASTVLVVTWEKVQQKNRIGGVYEGFATFQVAVAVSEKETYALVLYKNNATKWVVPEYVQVIDIDIGATIREAEKPLCQDFALSRTRDALRMDDIQGNIGKKGAWVYKLGDMTATTEQACIDWYFKNQRIKDLRKPQFDQLPKCPCVKSYTNRMEAFGIWAYANYQRHGLQDGKYMYCYRLTRAASQRFYPFGKECCYKHDRYEPFNSIYLLVQDKPDAAAATAYNPTFPELYKRYLQEDLMAYYACCVNSNSSAYCDKFYELRPIGECESNPPFVMATLCCDPFILTLDEGGYTFNGWGEYTMVTTTSPVAFTLQARTDLAETETGKLTNATVFTAFGAQENGIRLFIGLDPSTRNSLVIYAQDEDFSGRFQNDTNFQVDTDDFFMRRDNDSIEVSLPSGVSVRISIRAKSLAMSLGLPDSFRNKTRGLLGNFNGKKNDDFILPNGTSMGSSPTERQIFETFGSAWAVTADNSVLRYGKREGPQNYSHPEFVPLFLDEQPVEVRNRAKDKCGDNLACQYDFFATGSETFAMVSKDIMEDADRTNGALENSVPRLRVPRFLQVVAGQTVTFRINATDEDGDSITYHIEDENQGVRIDSSTGIVTFTPDINTPITMRFYAMDAKSRSPSQSVEVFVCSGCTGHGRCDYSNTRRVEPISLLFQVAECICDAGWEGQDCETDTDGCADNPCMEGQTCRDLTPQEQGNSSIGFDCGPCPPGFGRFPGEVECRDVDECQGSNDCQMTCTNTYGSFECGCRAGYRLHSDGRTCLDINECDEKTSSCQQICNNTVGGYECGCEAGYTLEVSGETCRQTEEFVRVCMYSACSQGCKPGVDPRTGEPALQCFCFAGYDNVTEDSAECRDHDECQDSDNPCSQRCVDFDGGFSCSCYDGYYLADDKVTCLPCSHGNYGPSCQYRCRCSGHGVSCDNVRGCICQTGWLGNQCQDDIDECTENPNACGSKEECFNTPGSYLCRCLDGYERDSLTGTCTDVDECSELSLLNTCGERQICTNIPGSFYCTCMQGYKLSNGQCQDIDECALGISDCEHECTNLPGSYNCECHYGYRLNTDRATCSSVSNLCASEENLFCDHSCTLNEDNSAVCVCNLGFSLDSDKQTCSRVRTCDTFGCSHVCTTVYDRPTCSCPLGKMLDVDQKACQDCPEGTFGVNCASNCSCGLGALRCNVSIGCVCKDGWTGQRCEQDENECDVTSVYRQCQAIGAYCENTPGSYRCVCLDGFAMDDSGYCRDVDECRLGLCGQECENSPGSYRCLCSRGFSLDQATGSCRDIDECALSATNRCTQTCINLDGSYRCACNRTGFVLSADQITCIESSSCSRTDCPTENGGCSKENCFCNLGYQLSASHTCELSSSSVCSQSVCEQECQEVSSGSVEFQCSCRDGYILNADERTCREKDLSSGCKRTDCPKENGGCSRETCFCNSGYRLTESNTCEAIDAPSGCKRTDCPKENGGCSKETCFCNSGYRLTESNTCRSATLEQTYVIFTVDVNPSVEASQFYYKNSTTYIAWAQSVYQELLRKLSPVGAGIAEVRVTNLRIGSLIVNADVLVDERNNPDTMSSLAKQFQQLRSDMFSAQGQSGSVTQMSINGVEVNSSWTSCQVLQIISPCSEEQECDDSGDLPHCRSTTSETDQTEQTEIIAIAVAVFVFVALAAIIAVLVIRYKLKKKYRTSTANSNPNTQPDSEKENPYHMPTEEASEHPYAELNRPGSASNVVITVAPASNAGKTS